MDHSQDSETNISSRQSSLENALREFTMIIDEARERQVLEPTSVSLATADINGQPSVRTIYLLSISEEGPVFFINANSGKGKQIAANPLVALCMHVPELQQQITLEGRAQGMSDQASDELWHKRSRDSQLASWVSDQSTTAQDRSQLTEKRDHMKSEFGFSSVPRPSHWKALQIIPSRIEFWQTGWHRLKQRRLYHQDDNGGWVLEIENP